MEFINRNELLKALDKYQKPLLDSFLQGKMFFKLDNEIIREQPAADVVEVKHGEWLPDYETFVDEWERESEPIQTGWVCSLCGRQEFNREPYCHCGAKMDGGKKELPLLYADMEEIIDS